MFKLLLFSLLSFITGADSLSAAPGADLIFVGDAMQHQAQLDVAKTLGNGKGYDYSDCFTYIAPTITEADYAVCNLEVPLGGGPDYTGYPCFSAPDSYAQALKDAGFDMFLTANNHCLDRRDRAARRTISALDSLGVDHIGTYRDSLDREEKVPFIKDIKGIKFGFLNYTYGTNGIEPQDGVEVALINRERMAREIRETRDAGAEIVVVAIHWGIEYVLLPNAVQKATADFLIDQGVDLIIGGHPHVIQPMEIRHNDKEDKNVLLVYSLGNFISNMKTADTRGGALVRARIERDSDGRARLVSANYDTFFSAKPTGAGSNFTVIPSWMPDKMPTAQRDHWLIFDRGAQNIFTKHNIGVPRAH
jgi:poly-gamma-glutamate synthesis protein (capsule biosynthesis protein)